jgi:gluconolactonase
LLKPRRRWRLDREMRLFARPSIPTSILSSQIVHQLKILITMKNEYIKFHLLWILIVSCEQISFSQSHLPPGAILEKLRTGFLQPEGPVWKDGTGLLFSDIRANKIYRWSPVDSSLAEYLNPSDSSNGLTLDQQGRLILTQMAKRRVARQELNEIITNLTSTYNGKKYNSPNDLVVKSDGSIFFTDPDFNTPNGQTKEMGFKGVFRISPYGIVYALDSTTFDKPNGICFSPDETKLYVNESPLGKIYAWDVVNDSTISNKRLFYTIPLGGYADGMKVDASGNLYCTGPTGVWIISPAGLYLDKIAMTETPSNCAWGDSDGQSLYITAGQSLYRIRMIATGVETNPERQSRGMFELQQNFPNPCNPQTTVTYRIPTLSRISLKVFDLSGREISVLKDREEEGGIHSATFDGSHHASGIYLVQLMISPKSEKRSFVQTRKLVLLK